jgi:hypothetical protein
MDSAYFKHPIFGDPGMGKLKEENAILETTITFFELDVLKGRRFSKRASFCSFAKSFC